MVREQLYDRGIRLTAVLEAMARVPRENFVPPDLRTQAYSDRPLPITKGQTISQPYVVGLMLAALTLKPSDKVLEIGTGSGYAAAVLGQMVTARALGEVYTVERIHALAKAAQARLAANGFEQVQVLWGDGTLGWPEFAPYDAILVSAGGPSVPPTLQGQLAVGGRLVLPVGKQWRKQRLIRVTRTEGGFVTEDLASVSFVPLIGAEGWSRSEPKQGESDV